MLRYIPLTLDLSKVGDQQTVTGIRQNDSDSIRFIITLTNGSSPFAVGSDNYAVVYGIKPDGKIFYNYAEIIDGKVYYTLTSQNTAIAGTIRWQLKIGKVENSKPTIFGSPRFSSVVEPSEIIPDEVISSDEFTLFLEAINNKPDVTPVSGGQSAFDNYSTEPNKIYKVTADGGYEYLFGNLDTDSIAPSQWRLSDISGLEFRTKNGENWEDSWTSHPVNFLGLSDELQETINNKIDFVPNFSSLIFSSQESFKSYSFEAGKVYSIILTDKNLVLSIDPYAESSQLSGLLIVPLSTRRLFITHNYGILSSSLVNEAWSDLSIQKIPFSALTTTLQNLINSKYDYVNLVSSFASQGALKNYNFEVGKIYRLSLNQNVLFSGCQSRSALLMMPGTNSRVLITSNEGFFYSVYANNEWSDLKRIETSFSMLDSELQALLNNFGDFLTEWSFNDYRTTEFLGEIVNLSEFNSASYCNPNTLYIFTPGSGVQFNLGLPSNIISATLEYHGKSQIITAYNSTTKYERVREITSIAPTFSAQSWTRSSPDELIAARGTFANLDSRLNTDETRITTLETTIGTLNAQLENTLNGGI